MSTYVLLYTIMEYFSLNENWFWKLFLKKSKITFRLSNNCVYFSFTIWQHSVTKNNKTIHIWHFVLPSELLRLHYLNFSIANMFFFNTILYKGIFFFKPSLYYDESSTSPVFMPYRTITSYTRHATKVTVEYEINLV